MKVEKKKEQASGQVLSKMVQSLQYGTMSSEEAVDYLVTHGETYEDAKYLVNDSIDKFNIPNRKVESSEEDSEEITIEEDVRLPGTDILLEKGDKIRIINEIKSDTPILPIGSVNMITGDNKILSNVFETWDDGNTTFEFWKVREGKIVAVITAGKKPLNKVGDRRSFAHDQTGRPLFEGAFIEMIGYCRIENLSEKGPQIVGKKTVSSYVYK